MALLLFVLLNFNFPSFSVPIVLLFIISINIGDEAFWDIFMPFVSASFFTNHSRRPRNLSNFAQRSLPRYFIQPIQCPLLGRLIYLPPIPLPHALGLPLQSTLINPPLDVPLVILKVIHERFIIFTSFRDLVARFGNAVI